MCVFLLPSFIRVELPNSLAINRVGENVSYNAMPDFSYSSEVSFMSQNQMGKTMNECDLEGLARGWIAIGTCYFIAM